jgi:RNAse (barnase) inhibitor barstar
MTRSTSQFQFDHSPLESSPALVAELPAGIKTKEALLDELYRRLSFPDYFGFNWDALVDCIRDLSWLPPGPVVLMHRDLPLAGDVGSQKTYLSILRDTVEKRGEVPGGMRFRDLVVVFPPDTKEQVARLLQSVDHDEAAWQHTTT